MARYVKQQQLVDQVVGQMEICADMMGIPDQDKQKKYGFVPGLGETESEKVLRERIKTIEQGIFQVMFTGTFSAGKSTLLNALMHSEVLATGPLPETAVITKIIFHDDDERVVIYRRDQTDDKGQPDTVVMKDIKEFFRKFHVDHNNTDKFLKLVDHVVLYQRGDGIAGSMVQLVDSPGTRASEADDKMAWDFAEKADALVFLINAQMALDKDDKAYIAKHLANRQMKNVFFAVNKVNLVFPDENVAQLKKYVEENLHDVFLDANGCFDQKLYEKRVFYVDAFGSMNTRLGRETQVSARSTEMIPDDETGVPELEAALEEFLTSQDKDKAALSAYRSQMADLYLVAKQSATIQLENLKKGKVAVERDLQKFRKEKERFQREIQDISEDIESARKDILRDIKDVYDDFVNAVDAEWDDYFSEKSGEMGVHMFKLLTAKAGSILKFWQDKSLKKEELETKTAEATKDFRDGINSFMELRNEEMDQQFRIKIKSRLEALTVKLNNHQQNLNNMNIPVDITEILEMIAREHHVEIPATQENNAKLGQALTAIMLGDPELLVTSAQGDKGIIEFLGDVIKTNVLDLIVSYILLYLFGNFVGVIFFVLVKVVKTGMRGDTMVEKLIAETKNVILNGDTDKEGNSIPGLRREGKERYLAKTEAVIGGSMLRASNSLTNGIMKKLTITERNLEYVLKNLEENENAFQTEHQRMNKIMDSLASSISKMSELTTGTPLTVEGIEALASRNKK